MEYSSERCVVIGASAGGVETLKEVVAGLPSDFAAPVFVVLHIPPFEASTLAEILDHAGPLPALHPEDGDEIQPGMIYVAPPDRHLLINNGFVAVKAGPHENRFRPSIDALFRSAAYIYGVRAIGVVLTGALDDGTSGLWSINRLGGITIVQEPHQAQFQDMPLNALKYVDVDYRIPSTEMGPVLGRLICEPLEKSAGNVARVKARMAAELKIAIDARAFQRGIMEFGELTPFTCPECHGVLVRIEEGKIFRYRCHTGHAFTDSSLLEAVVDSTGDMLWQVVRSVEESATLLKDMGSHLEEAGESDRARTFFAKAKMLEKCATGFHSSILVHERVIDD